MTAETWAAGSRADHDPGLEPRWRKVASGWASRDAHRRRRAAVRAMASRGVRSSGRWPQPTQSIERHAASGAAMGSPAESVSEATTGFGSALIGRAFAEAVGVFG